MLGRLLGAIGAWIGAGLCGYGIYKIIETILSGVTTSNWLMVIGGGIIGYLFGGFLLVGGIALTALGIKILFD